MIVNLVVMKVDLLKENQLFFRAQINRDAVMEHLPLTIMVRGNYLNTIRINHNPFVIFYWVLSVDVKDLLAEVQKIVFGQNSDIIHDYIRTYFGKLVINWVFLQDLFFNFFIIIFSFLTRPVFLGVNLFVEVYVISIIGRI